MEIDPNAIELRGQVGKVAGENVANPIRPLDATTASGNALDADRITVNLLPITHPAELPPITMMNWLILIEERRGEFY